MNPDAHPEPKRPTRAVAAAGIVLLAVVCAGVFGRVAGHALLDYDDRYHVADNPWFATINAQSFTHFWQAPYGNLYIPVAYNALALEVASTKWVTNELLTAQLDPTLLHIVNVALHAVNSALVFLLLVRLVGAFGPALIGALLFALHPLQVESVAWIAETRGLLAATFALAAVVALCRAIEPRATRPIRALGYAAGLLLFGAALLSKPSAVTTPIVAAAVLWAGGTPAGRIARAVAPWMALSIAAVIITSRTQAAAALGAAPALWQRLMIAADALCFYTAKLVWPAALAPDYGRTPAYVLETSWPFVAMLVVVIACAAALFLFRRSRLALTGFAIAVGSLLPVLGLVPFHHQVISTVADRYMYVPIVGIGLIAAAGMAQVHSRAAWCAALVGVSVLGLSSFVQSAYWVNDETLWRHNVTAVPRSPLAHNNLGRRLQQQGRLTEAEPLLQRAVEIDDRSSTALVNLAELRVVQGRSPDAERLYRRALDAAPNSPRAAVGLGVLLAETGRQAEARAMFEQALAVDPENVEAMNNLGAMLLRSGDIARGTTLVEAVVARDPAHVGALFNLGLVHANAGQWLRAGELWQRASDAGMRGADVRMRAGDAFAQASDFQRAARAYRDAAAEDPRAYEPYNKLGLLFVRQRRYGEAVDAFERALARAPDAPEPAANLRKARQLNGQ